MSYAIVNVIYGLPLTDGAREILEEAGVEPIDVGFEMLYSGRGSDPGFIGVKVVAISEAGREPIPFSAIISKVMDLDDAIRNRVRAEIDELAADADGRLLRAALPEEVGFYVVFSAG